MKFSTRKQKEVIKNDSPFAGPFLIKYALILKDLMADAKAGELEISYFAKSSFAKTCLLSRAASLRALC